MVAEGGRHVIVNAEPMRDVDFESLAQVLEKSTMKTSEVGPPIKLEKVEHRRRRRNRKIEIQVEKKGRQLTSVEKGTSLLGSIHHGVLLTCSEDVSRKFKRKGQKKKRRGK
jgi:hypothetical protein